MTGYKGDNLAIYILNHRQFMHDTQKFKPKLKENFDLNELLGGKK